LLCWQLLQVITALLPAVLLLQVLRCAVPALLPCCTAPCLLPLHPCRYTPAYLITQKAGVWAALQALLPTFCLNFAHVQALRCEVLARPGLLGGSVFGLDDVARLLSMLTISISFKYKYLEKM
jgi:hypothetical protein